MMQHRNLQKWQFDRLHRALRGSRKGFLRRTLTHLDAANTVYPLPQDKGAVHKVCERTGANLRSAWAAATHMNYEDAFDRSLCDIINT